MKKPALVIVLLLVIVYNACSQPKYNYPTQRFATDLQKLIEINASSRGGMDLSGKESVDLYDSASASQIIEITCSYFPSGASNAKTICFYLLAHTFLTRTNDPLEKKKIVEMICTNYLDSYENVEMIHNAMFYLQEKDFTAESKKHVRHLIGLLNHPDIWNTSKLLGLAQIRESIPELWKAANQYMICYQNNNYSSSKCSFPIDVLASLARMNEHEAGTLLCHYYDSTKNRTDYRYIFIVNRMAFSMDTTVLNCLIRDFKSIDINIKFHDGDSYFYPSGYLGTAIASMLKNYPYSKKYSDIDPKQLLVWLNDPSNNFELKEK